MLRTKPLRRPSATVQFVALFALIFLIHLVVHAPALFQPPADDHFGLFIEAHFLFESGFDYRALIAADEVDEGGPRSYVTTLLPSLIALLRTAGLSPKATILSYRLFTFACNSLLLILLFQLLRTRCGTSIAALATLSHALLPLWFVQAQMLGMEIPMVAFAVLAAHFVAREKFGWALGAAALSFAMKNSGIVVAVAIGIHCLILSHRRAVGVGGKVGSDRLLYYGLMALSVAAIEFAAAYVYGGLEPRLEHERSLFLHLLTLLVCCGDLLLLFGVSCLAAIAWLSRTGASADSGGSGLASGPIGRWWRFLCVEPLWLFSWLMMLGVIAATSFVFLHPRYLLLAIPFLAVSLGIEASALWTGRGLAIAAFALLALFNWSNRYGAFFPPLPDAMVSSQAFVERDLSYLARQEAILKAAQIVEQASDGRPVVASELLTHALTNTTAGYVTRPQHGYTTLAKFWGNQFEPISALVRDAPQEVVVTVLNDPFRADWEFEYPPPRPDDLVLFQGRILPSGVPIIVYVRRLERPSDIDDLLISLLAPNEGGWEMARRLSGSVAPNLEKRFLQRLRERTDGQGT